MDAWVLKVSMAFPLVCLVGLTVWHLVSHLIGILVKKTRNYRHALASPKPRLSLSNEQALAGQSKSKAPAVLPALFDDLPLPLRDESFSTLLSAVNLRIE
jgi:hypothetical protein